MTRQSDPVTTIHRDLLCRQLAQIRNRHPARFESQQARLASYLARGRINLRSVLQTSGVSEDAIAACMQSAATDRRFAFVHRLPQSAALGTAVGDAIETCFTGAVSQASSELTTLIDVFMTVLDGLIDDTPELIASETEQIADLMGATSPLWQRDLAFVAHDKARHPLVDVVYRLLFDGARRLRQSSHWSSDPTLPAAFALAVERAIGAEYASHQIQTIGACVEPERDRSLLERKSENAVWVEALVPVCVNGWPATLDRDRYEAIARAIGRYFGWLDDLSDIFLDLGYGRWNAALLTIHRHIAWPATASPTARQFAVATALSFDHIADRLVATGTALYDDLMQQLGDFGANCEVLLHLIADATSSWLAVPTAITPHYDTRGRL